MGKLLHNRVNRRELKQRIQESAEARTTISFYKYFNISSPQLFRDKLFVDFSNLGVMGRIYVAEEGINAQISVPTAQLEAFKEYMNTYEAFHQLRLNIAIEDDGKSFFALIIKVRDKIVADGITDPNFDPAKTGTHLKADEWNQLMDDPDAIVVDMRNHYESEIGHFQQAIVPDVATFREELPYVADLLAEQKDKKILMYCTGGIRCEKASAYMKYRGFENVFQLEGGIIEYARVVKQNGLENKFLGKNFVFDERLGERIGNDIIAQCHQCGAPCDNHTNCVNPYCHILFIQCDACKAQFQGSCSVACADFMQIPETERKLLAPKMVFNGSKFGKGVYKAFRKSAYSLRSVPME
ncbi:MAG: rhodanese-related sulfurtransferase [Bacteroidetes bacterium]|nr:rhodanese-related sulfurtransferase [Bacteroidota bacterium]